MNSCAGIMEHDLELWHYWGFEEWNWNGLTGVTRRVRFVKGALLGEVARYFAEDTIIWNCGDEYNRELLWRSLCPKEDVVSQRFMFLLDRPKPLRQIRSFLFGLRGFAEYHSYWPGGCYDVRLKDLAPLVDKALCLYKENSNIAVSE